ncbi:phosphatase PAP2 family protein [Cellulomonas sp. URHD0024]|uniref:phosphatase PAP2 family protein n=1 Tax=Cellulomonas sp. URHD0024 TaxID=1302620 RepID=UPI0003F61E63|nr:phosphatase PAP2 family protein [Cellulomonas sp. URHD0024]
MASPRRRPAPLVELAFLVLVVLVFLRLHAATGHDLSAAAIHARTLQTLERTLGIDIVLPVNAWLVGQPVLITLAVLVYRSYYLAVLGVLVWVYVRHAEIYRVVRRTLVAMLVLILPVYWAMPMSPPRFALPGVVDVVAEHDVVAGHRPDGYTAMPSNHVALSAWCAYAVWLALRPVHPRLALLAWLFPLVMSAVVLTTGNHYVLDIVGSLVLVGASVGVATIWGRLADRRRALNPLAAHG